MLISNKKPDDATIERDHDGPLLSAKLDEFINIINSENDINDKPNTTCEKQ